MKVVKILSFLVCMVCLFFSLSSCESTSKSNNAYWFSKYKTRFVAYDDAANENKGNIDDAGNYWEMTVKKDCKISISVKVNTDMFSTNEFFVNGEKVLSEDPSNTIYSFIYKDLNLKKGDEIKMHTLWVNSVITTSEGFNISVFSITDSTGEYIITDIN